VEVVQPIDSMSSRQDDKKMEIENGSSATKQPFFNSAKRCCENARRLLDEAEFLEYEEPPATRFFLSMVAQEETSKAFLLYLVMVDAIPWTPFLFRATRDHRSKQLVGIILDYMCPDCDESLRRLEERISKGKGWGFPRKVADALNLLYHEKIRRWEESFVWEEDPEYERTALGVSKGKQEKKKQRSLYVELQKDGRVVQTPQSITSIEADAEYERGRRFEQCVSRLFDEERGSAWELETVEQYFKIIFSQSIETEEGQEL